jgi:hypothetical protein
MSSADSPAAGEEVSALGAAAAVADGVHYGELIDACAIDLPLNDVVEAIEFERFFIVNASLGDLRRPVTLMSALLSMRSEDLSERELTEVNRNLLLAAPLSNKRREWGLYERAEALQVEREKNSDSGSTPGDDFREFAAGSEPIGEASSAAEETLYEERTADTGRLEASSAALEADERFIEGPGTSTGPETALPQAQLPDISHYRIAFYLPYRQEWQLDGYSRGRMVNSLTLGPQEEQTIEIFKWDRLSRTLDSTTSFEFAQTSESSGSRRDTTDISREVSRQSGFELTSNAKVGFKVDVVNADFGGGTSAKAGLNDADKNARQTIAEATTRAATNVRSSRTLKVVETRESGEETRVTRKLRNHNSCHTLTTTFFEILADYTVATYLRTDEIRLVLLLPSAELSKIKRFDRRFVRSHERTLMLALLDQTLAPGFEAARFLDARERACAILCAGCDCGIETGVGASNSEWDALKAALENLGRAVAALRAGVSIESVVSAWVSQGVLGAAGATVRRRLFLKALARYTPRLLADLGGLNLASGSVTPGAANSAMATISALRAEDLDMLRSPDEALQIEVWWEVWGVILLILTEPIATTITTGAFFGAIGGLGSFDDAGLVAAMADVAAKYAAWQARLAEQRERDEARAELERIAAEERALRVLDAFPLRATADAGERLEALLDHLNDERNIDHYRFAVWNERAGSTDPALLMLALAKITEGAPVGAVGDYLAVPLRIPDGSVLEAFFNESIEDLLELSPRDEDPHILPTAALYAEAIPGECCACEDTVVRREELELKQREVENELLEAERDRRQAKLQANDLSGETTTEPLRVELVNASADGTTPTP